MTWKEFKEQVESQGVTDEMDLDFIDINDCAKIKINISPRETSFDVTKDYDYIRNNKL